MSEILYHYYKHDKKEVKDTIDWLKKEFPSRGDTAVKPAELMAYEGEAWSKFYGTFKYFLPEDFIMNKRVKRPPDNPINAVISFDNTLYIRKQFLRYTERIWINVSAFCMNPLRPDFP